ncbi:hypothetical protein ROZALSC1DRAFT_25350, partial [Rozella allomycis CSF55]
MSTATPTELEKLQKEIQYIEALQEKDFTYWTAVEKRKYGKNEDDAYENLREAKKALIDLMKSLIDLTKARNDQNRSLIGPQNLKLQLQLQQAVPMEVERSKLELFLTEFSEEIKEDCSVVHPLSNNAFQEVVDRDGCLRGIANEILRRWLLKDVIDHGINDWRSIDRFIGLQAPLGGGKSQMMDYIAALKGLIMDHVDVAAVYKGVYSKLKLREEFAVDMLNAKVANLKEMLNESVYIPISFNGETTIKRNETCEQAIAIRILYSYFIDKSKELSLGSFGVRLSRVGEFSMEGLAIKDTETADASIAVRILYSYFIDKRRTTFDGFSRRLDKIRFNVTISDCLYLVYEHSKKESLFVLFDEIGKVQTLERMYACLRGLTSIITGIAFSRCHVIISSLEISNMMISVIKSSRHIRFVPLNPLSVDSSLKLFRDYTRFEHIKHLIVTLRGHPRCLE